MKVEVQAKPGQLPNFITLDGLTVDGSGLSALIVDGTSVKIDVADLTDEQVDTFIEEWGASFRHHVKTRRASRKNER